MRSVYFVTLGLFAGVLVAQYNRSTISGTILDSSNGLVPGAKVKIAAPSIGLERITATGDSGYFIVPGLPPAVYDVTVEKAGFKASSRSSLTLDPDATLDLNFVLIVGNVTERVDVSAECASRKLGSG
jgi:hypothetical protein